MKDLVPYIIDIVLIILMVALIINNVCWYRGLQNAEKPKKHIRNGKSNSKDCH